MVGRANAKDKAELISWLSGQLAGREAKLHNLDIQMLFTEEK